MKAITTTALLSLFVASAQAAMIFTLNADTANSSSEGFSNGTVAGVVSDTFSYDPFSPTSPAPDQTYSANGDGFHGNTANNVDVLLSYTLSGGIHTTIANEATIVVDLYGRATNGGWQDRDDDIDVQLFNGDYVTAVATISGLSINNGGTSHVRATFDSLTIGTQFDRIRITGHDSGGGSSFNYFTLMEARVAAVPEPSSTALLSLGGLALILRRRK